ncbi:sulfate adenylyltransferase subunit 2 [Oligoflexia bacterium]|nr:sulfate adenylyltransferase subunit 2 [Oligoflexia bacterium]
MNYLDQLENNSIYVIREAYHQFKNLTLLWSIGKDSTTLLWLCRKAFFGEIPFEVMHIDTTFKFPEMYAFRDHWAKEWGLNLVVEKNEEAIAKGINYDDHDAFTCCHELKTVALQKAIIKRRYDALLVGIRRDEHSIRAKERVFSPRNIDFKWDYKNQSPEMWDHYQSDADAGQHLRVHPLLQWTELDIWKYIEREGIPTNELYFAKNGKRYRSLGCMPITTPVESEADTLDKIVEELLSTDTAERSGRAQDKESAYMMQKLRSLGYM